METMANIILFHFEQSEVRFVGTAEKPEWVAADICKILGIDTSEAVNGKASRPDSGLDEDEKGTALVGTLGGDQEMLTVTQSGVFQLIFKSKKPEAKRLKRWLAHEVLPSLSKTGTYSIEQDRDKLERKFLPIPTTKEIKEAYSLYKMAYGKAYADRWLQQKMLKYQPTLAGDAPNLEESASLPTAKALLTPTQIAEQLGLFCKSNAKSGDARRVNKLLQELGYQTKIDGVWSATDKAIDLNLCDRKPVDTNSRSQKDQLLWSADVLVILQEHAIDNP
jgi:prophage antirepressor-like protein